MGIETKTKEIGGIKFEVTQHAYFRAQRLFTRLLKLAGPSLLGIAQIAGQRGSGAMGALLNMEVDQLTPALGALFEQLDPALVESVTCEILDGARASLNGQTVLLVEGGRPKMMDLVIGGDFWTGLALQAWALSVHFGNFSSARAAFGVPAGQPPTQ